MHDTWKKHKEIIIISLLFLVGEAIFALSRQRALIWDEAVYVGMGKFLYSFGKSGLWEIFRPITMPLAIGVLWKIGLDTILASRVLAVLLATACIAMTYLIADKVFGRRAALLASVLLATTPVFVKYSEYLLTDIPSLLFVLVTVYLILERRYFLAGISSGVAFLTKFPQLLMLLPLAAYILLEKGPRSAARDKVRHLLMLFMGCALIIICFTIFNISLYSSHLSILDSSTRPVTDAMAFQNNPLQNLPTGTVQQKAYSAAYYLINVVGIMGSLLFILALLTVAQSCARKKARHGSTLLTYVLIAYLLYYSAIPYKTERFLLFFIPIVSILAAAAFFYVLDMKRRAINIALYIFVGVALAVAVYQDAQIYHQKADMGGHEIIAYSYFAHNDIKGTMLVTDPLFAAYSDNRFIPIYNTMNDGTFYVDEWEKNSTADGAAFSENSIPCADRSCIARRDALLESINSSYSLVFYDATTGWRIFAGRRVSGQRAPAPPT
jgi:hypothetical protein